ncbi:MAG: ribosomal protein S18-alanine N-acetyltransferase [Burkholderiales bacterium]
MNAVLRDAHRLEKMTTAHLGAVMAIENEAYPFPWTRGNFIDSLASGYPAQVLFDSDRRQRAIGYFVAMEGVDEMHLLNLTVAPEAQSQGHGRFMLDALVDLCRQRRALQLWLEVRQSNPRARALYQRYGFRDMGVRRGYYPAAAGRREDALVMSLDVSGGSA